MNLGIFSDLHLEFAPWWNTPHPDVLYLNAGDTSPGVSTRGYVSKLWDPFVTVMGNHDYYDGSCPEVGAWQTLAKIDGLTVAGATLWTPMNKKLWERYAKCLTDKRKMSAQWTMEQYIACHKSDLDFLKKSGADVIITHHAPSRKSIHPRYLQTDGAKALNGMFCGDLDAEILNWPKPPKLWIHGHVHDRHDYMLGNTRVVCNPRGYPNEDNFHDYSPLEITI